ncbi:MAG: SPOR domain-containing protein [Rhodoferax sp.]
MSDTLPPPMQEPTGLPDLAAPTPDPAADPVLEPLSDPVPEPAPAAMTLDTAPGNATQALYAAAIGPVSTARYLRLFTRMEASGRSGWSWNWAASLCTLGWMLFRRMGTAALAYLGALAGLLLVVGLLVAVVFAGQPEVQAGVGLVASLLAWGVPGLRGDAWLQAHCKRRMARALADSRDWNDAVALLAGQAVTRSRAGWLAGAHAAVLAAVAGLAVTVPWPPGGEGLGAVSAAPAPAASAALRPADGAASAVSASASASATPSLASAAAASAPASAPVAAASIAAAATGASGASSTATSLSPEPATAASAPGPQLAASVAALGTAVALSPPSVVASAKIASAATKAPAATKASTPKSPATDKRHLLNVGLFAVESNAQAAHARLQAAGLPATIETLQTRNGPRTRVRAGPFASAAAAEAAARRIRAMGLEAQPVVPRPGSTPPRQKGP